MWLRAAADDLLSVMLPARCPGCGARGVPLCDTCAGTLRSAPPALPPFPITWWTACFAYEGVARELVARAKYRDERRALEIVTVPLTRAIARAPMPIDIVTWAPASAQRRRARGIDHAELLARAVARTMGHRVEASLQRGPGSPQTGLDARARRAGPPLRATRRYPGMIVLVVDDVATTGGTLAAAARALRDAGACAVYAATIARTPGPGRGAAPPAYTSATTPS